MTLASRESVNAAMVEVVEDVPAKLRARISTEEWQDWWIDAFRTRLQRGERDAVRLYPELLRMVGAEDRRLELALGALGVSLEIAKRAVGMYQAVEGMDMAAMLETARSVIERAGGTVIMPAQMVEGAAVETASGALVHGVPGIGVHNAEHPPTVEPGGAGVPPAGATPGGGSGVPPAMIPGSNSHATEGGNGHAGS